MTRFSKGWVKAWRDMIDGDLPQNIWLWGIWNWLLLTATWQPSSILWKGNRREIPAGSVVMGLVELSNKWECSPNTIKRWLKYLHDSERIYLESCTRGTLVTIRNWDVYQANEETDCKPSANELQTNCKPSATYEESKKERNTYEQRKRRSEVKSSFDLEKLYQGYPRKKGKTPGIRKLSKDILSEQDYEDLRLAIQNYAKEVQGTESRYVLHFSTFAGQWRDWVQLVPDSPNSDPSPKLKTLEDIAQQEEATNA